MNDLLSTPAVLSAQNNCYMVDTYTLRWQFLAIRELEFHNLWSISISYTLMRVTSSIIAQDQGYTGRWRFPPAL